MLFLNKFDIFEKKILEGKSDRHIPVHFVIDGRISIVIHFRLLVYHLCAGSTQCMWLVQRLSTSFNRETRDWACIWV